MNPEVRKIAEALRKHPAAAHAVALGFLAPPSVLRLMLEAERREHARRCLEDADRREREEGRTLKPLREEEPPEVALQRYVETETARLWQVANRREPHEQ